MPKAKTDMDKLSEFNDGVNYLLNFVYVSSCFVRVQPMESKYSTDAIAAFKKCYKKTSHKKYGLIKEHSLMAIFGNFVDKRESKFFQREVKQKLP